MSRRRAPDPRVRILVRALFGAMPLESAVDRGAAQRREAEFLT